MHDSILQVFPAMGRTLEDLSALPDPLDNFTKRLLFADGAITPLSLETHVHAYWSRASLFILFAGRFLHLRMTFEELPTHLGGRTPQLWEKSDVYEVMIGRDCARTGRYKEFQIAPNGKWFAADIHNRPDAVVTDDTWDVAPRCTTLIDAEEKIWRAGLEIPWTALGGFEGGGEWQCNFYRATGKFHGDELLAWCPTGYGERCFHRPHLFGTIKIVENCDAVS
jgi:hypothetical protein